MPNVDVRLEESVEQHQPVGASPVELARAQVPLQVFKEKSMDWTLCTHVVEPVQP